MLKAFLLILTAHCVGAVNFQVHDDAGLAQAADEELQTLQDLSNENLWHKAWSDTLAKHATSDALLTDNLKKVLYPEAQILFQNLIKARHRLKAKMQAQQAAEQQQQDAAQEQDHQFEEDAKAGFLQRMTAGINDINNDPLPSTTTATTTIEDPKVVKEREQMADLKEKEMSKMMAGVAETKDEDTPHTTTTTVDPAARAEEEHMEQLKEAEMAKLTSKLDDNSIAAAEATATTTTKTTTTTTTMNAAGKKMLAELSSGKFYKHALNSMNFAGLQTDQQQPQEDDKQDNDDSSETMTDLDEYGF